jgi:hypothetical protein
MNNMTPLEQQKRAWRSRGTSLKDTLGDAAGLDDRRSGIMPVLSEGVKVLTGWLVENKDGIGAGPIHHPRHEGRTDPRLGSAGRCVQSGQSGLVWTGGGVLCGAAIWDTLKIGVLDLVATIDKAMIALDTALEKGLRFHRAGRTRRQPASVGRADDGRL